MKGGLFVLKTQVLPASSMLDTAQVMPLHDAEGSEHSEHEELDIETKDRPDQAREQAVPKMPVKAVQDQHRLTHLPFQPWCDVCVKAKSVDDPHFRHAEREFEKVDEPALVQMDFTFVQGMKILTLYCLENG